jgi:hypothetical protein
MPRPRPDVECLTDDLSFRVRIPTYIGGRLGEVSSQTHRPRRPGQQEGQACLVLRVLRRCVAVFASNYGPRP